MSASRLSRALIAAPRFLASATRPLRRTTTCPTSRNATNNAMVPSRIPTIKSTICQVWTASGVGGGGMTGARRGTPFG
ncbi:hypothetical protein [Actinophytocola oryzae]|uniref:hypothetical protein n=1 Tax=Actinophytocola oryzae TaxID=502181 RepID=UPI0010626C51|nr:hypothetical protein [Actinophytocola oryzae]